MYTSQASRQKVQQANKCLLNVARS